jgi:hypothetical protein
MGYNNVLGVELKEWYEFFVLVATKTYDNKWLENMEINEFIKISDCYEILPGDGTIDTYTLCTDFYIFKRPISCCADIRIIENNYMYLTFVRK